MYFNSFVKVEIASAILAKSTVMRGDKKSPAPSG